MKNNIRKLMAITLTLVLVLCGISITANAITPALKPFSMPSIPNFKVNVELPQSIFDNWFAEHPIELPTDKNPSENAGLNIPEIIEARYYHGQYSRLQVRWNKAEGADSYEVEIARADGMKTVYTTTSNSLYRTSADCPRIYIEETNTWASATVRIRALSGTDESQWSKPINIGCDKLHS